jgi:predicted transcriptional regulator
MKDLFNIENKIRIVEVNSIDVSKQTDNYRVVFDLIKKHQENYPNIEKWFKNKVVPGIKSNERGVYIGFNNEIPIASAVVKKGEHAKFCHLHIDEELRHQNIGDIFFVLMSIYIKKYAKDVHFSLPEGLWETKKNFFKSYGFDNVKKYETQYRLFEEELTTSIDYNTLWNNIVNKLPSLIEQFHFPIESPLNGILMSIQPCFSDKIMSGEKVIEIRKKFNKKWKNHTVAIYSSSPIRKLVGYATIQNINEDSPDIIWSKYSDSLGCTKSMYDDYTKGSEKVFAISLSNINKYHNPLALDYLTNSKEQRIYPPQSYSTVNKDKNLKSIISIAEIMQGRFNGLSPIY